MAIFALILHGAWHIGSHLASDLQAHVAAGHHHRAPAKPSADAGSDVQLPKHHHAAPHPGSVPDPVSGSDGGSCCCTGASCTAAFLPAGSATVRYAMPHRILAILVRDQDAQFKPEGRADLQDPA